MEEQISKLLIFLKWVTEKMLDFDEIREVRLWVSRKSEDFEKLFSAKKPWPREKDKNPNRVRLSTLLVPNSHHNPSNFEAFLKR